MEVVVKITQILPLQSGTSKSGREWKKVEFVGEVMEGNSTYPRHICFTLFGDNKVSMIEPYAVESLVTVSFDIDSNEFNGRWYTTVNAWRITPTGGSVQAPVASQQGGYAQPVSSPVQAPVVDNGNVNATGGAGVNVEDDLPF